MFLSKNILKDKLLRKKYFFTGCTFTEECNTSKKTRKNIFILGWLFFSCVSCVSAEKQTKEATLRHQMAQSYIKKCQYPSALSELEKAFKLRPKDPFLHLSFAQVYSQFKKYQKTIKHLKKALSLEPGFTEARVHLGRILIEIGQIEEALKELKKAKEDLTYRDTAIIHAHKGLAYYKQKKYALAEKHFSVARTVKKEACILALYHAKSFYFQNQFQKALDILEPSKKWCKKNLPLCFPPSFEPYFFSALAYDKIGQRQKAHFNLKTFLSQAQKSKEVKEIKEVKAAKELMKKWKLKLKLQENPKGPAPNL